MKIKNYIKNNFKVLIVGSFTAFVIYRINFNFKSYANAIKKEPIFDVKKATEQLKIYKEIYNTKDDLEDKHRLYLAASEDDKKKLKELFSKYDNMDKESIMKEIENKKKEIEFLKDKKIDHQGVKLAKIYYSYEPSEDALKKIRQEYNEHRKSIKDKNDNK